MTSTRCAACKYLRRRCPSNCILSPHFPPNDPQRFAYVHKIYGASNVAKLLQQVPMHQRAEAADSIYYEAYCRIKDPVYGCVGIITLLHQQIYNAQCEIAKIEAETAVLNSHAQREEAQQHEQVAIAPSVAAYSLEGNSPSVLSSYDNSTPRFY